MDPIIDLTYNLEEGMATFNAHWHVPVEITQLGRLGFEGRETRKITFGTHTGTHVDAPLHFIKNWKSIENIPLDKLTGPVSILDFSYLGNNGVVTKEMLRYITIKKKIIFKFGWGKYWNTKQLYQDYPFFSKEAAEYLVSLGVEMVAIDTPSPDDSRIRLQGEILGSSQDSPIHKIFLGNDVIIVEYLANLDSVNDYGGWNIIAFPLRIKGADGSPARVCIYKNNEDDKRESMPESIIKKPENKKKYRVEYNRPDCIGAGACVAVQPERWVIKNENTDNKADLIGGKENPDRKGIWFIEFTEEELELFISSATMCPVQVIKIFDLETGKQMTW